MATKKYTESEMNTSMFAMFFTGIFFTLVLGSIILAMFGAFDPPLRELDLEDKLAESYVLEYYPEFEGCTFDYIYPSSTEHNGKVKIYCNTLENRDGLMLDRDELADEVILLKDITLEEIFERILNDAISEVSE